MSSSMRDDWQPIPESNQNRPIDPSGKLLVLPNQSGHVEIQFGLDDGMMESVLIPEAQLKQLLESQRNPTIDSNVRQVDWWEREESFFHAWSKIKEEQETSEAELPDSAKLAATIDTELRKAKSDTQSDENAKAHHIHVLETAKEHMAKFKTYQQTITKYQSDFETFDTTLTLVKEKLAAFESIPSSLAINPDRSIEQLQRDIQTVQHEVDLKKSELQAATNETKKINQRIADVPKLKAEAQQRQKEIAERLTQPESATDDGSHLLQQAIQTATDAEIKMLGLETRHLELDSVLNPLQVDLASRELQRLESTVQQLKMAANRIRALEVQEQITLAREAATNAHPRLAELAQRNQDLASLRKKLVERIHSISDEKAMVADQSLKVEEELAAVRKQFDESVSTTKNLLLVETSRQMLSPVESRVRLSEIQSESQTLNTALFLLQEERQQLADPRVWLDSQLHWHPEETEPELQAMANKFVETRKSLMIDVLKDYRALIRLLGETAAQREKLIAGLENTRRFLGENMLWVQSTSPVSLNTLKTSSDGAQSFFAADAWNELVNKMLSRLTTRPQETLIYTMVFAGLFFVVKRLGA